MSTYSDWPKVSNQHGVGMKNLTQKSTTKTIIFHIKTNERYLEWSVLCGKSFFRLLLSGFDVERMHIIVQIYRIDSDIQTLQTAFINYAHFDRVILTL